MLLLIHGILLVYTLIGRIGLGIAVNTTGESWGNSVANLYGISAGFYILVYVLFMLATAIATFFYLAVRLIWPKKSFIFNKLQRHVGRIGRLRRIRHLRHLQYLTQNYRFNLSALRKSW